MTIEWLKALATAVIAIAGTVIAYAQLRLANIRLTHDLFDRRYAVYAAAQEFIRQICQNRMITPEELSSFHYGSGVTIFVLDQVLADYMEKLKRNAGRASMLYDKIKSGQASQADIDEHWKLLNWFSDQIGVLTQKFKPFLQYQRSWYNPLRSRRDD